MEWSSLSTVIPCYQCFGLDGADEKFLPRDTLKTNNKCKIKQRCQMGNRCNLFHSAEQRSTGEFPSWTALEFHHWRSDLTFLLLDRELLCEAFLSTALPWTHYCSWFSPLTLGFYPKNSPLATILFLVCLFPFAPALHACSACLDLGTPLAVFPAVHCGGRMEGQVKCHIYRMVVQVV